MRCGVVGMAGSSIVAGLVHPPRVHTSWGELSTDIPTSADVSEKEPDRVASGWHPSPILHPPIKTIISDGRGVLPKSPTRNRAWQTGGRDLGKEWPPKV